MKVNRTMAPFVSELEAFYRDSGVSMPHWNARKNYFYQKDYSIVFNSISLCQLTEEEKSKKWTVVKGWSVRSRFETLSECLRFVHAL